MGSHTYYNCALYSCPYRNKQHFPCQNRKRNNTSYLQRAPESTVLKL